MVPKDFESIVWLNIELLQRILIKDLGVFRVIFGLRGIMRGKGACNFGFIEESSEWVYQLKTRLCAQGGYEMVRGF